MYTMESTIDGRLIVCCRGVEFATADTEEQAAQIAAADAIAAYPEAAPDILYDVAANVGQIVGNVVHMTWFRNAVAEEIFR